MSIPSLQALGQQAQALATGKVIPILPAATDTEAETEAENEAETETETEND